MNTSGTPSPLVSATAGEEAMGLVVANGHPPTVLPSLAWKAYTLWSSEPTMMSGCPSRLATTGEDSWMGPVSMLHLSVTGTAAAPAARGLATIGVRSAIRMARIPTAAAGRR